MPSGAGSWSSVCTPIARSAVKQTSGQIFNA